MICTGHISLVFGALGVVHVDLVEVKHGFNDFRNPAEEWFID